MSSVALVPQREWITPEEQLDRLRYNLPVAKEVTRVAGMIKVLAQLVGEYTSDERLTNWYIALACGHNLPKQLPALPLDFVQMFCAVCPIFNKGRKPNEKERTVGDTHTLVLIPQEVGDFPVPEVQAVVRNPLFRISGINDLSEEGRQHISAPLWPTHWVLMTTDVIPGSRSANYALQVQLVIDLTASTGRRYEVPSLNSAIAIIFLHRIATGISLYSEGNGEIGLTYTRVQEKGGCQLVVGGFASNGLDVNDEFGFDNEFIGIAAMLKF